MFEQVKKKAKAQKMGGTSPVNETVDLSEKIPEIAETVKNLEGQLEADRKHQEFLTTIKRNMQQNSNERNSCCLERGGCCMG